MNDTRYLQKDHLGSVDVITDEVGSVVQRLSYDAFGRRRSGATWSSTPSSSDWSTIAATTHRGFTGHESLDNLGLIHMNGRVYDPALGRVISADPLIQAPFVSQSLNRYSYVMNNPLSMVDPSGYSWVSDAFHLRGGIMLNRWLKRSAIVAGSVLLGFVALWNAGVNPVEWFKPSPKQAVTSPPKPSAPSAPLVPQPVTNGQTRALAPLPGTDSSVSKKPLALLLARTMPGRNASEGTALIGVVLERNGRTARLYLQDLKDQNRPQTAANDLLTVGGVKKFKPAVATSSEPLTDYVRPSPVYDGAVLRGYEVYPGKHAGVFYQLGLQPGDLITSIDGAPLTDPAQAFAMLSQLVDGVALNATVNRKGKMEAVALDGARITRDREREEVRATH